MMKSFFKKLAFVMALAMVVSMAAPAGTAAFAADFYIADAADKKAETYKLAIGEKEDFKFKGAPADWKSYKWTWISNDEAVLTVDKTTGLATGVKDGVATITVTGVLNNVVKYTAKTVVTVGKGVVVNNNYDVVMTTNETIEIRFEGKNSYKLEDVILYYRLENDGEVENVFWPINPDKELTYVDKKGNFVITPFISFESECEYMVTLGEKDNGIIFTADFTTPDTIDITGYTAYTTEADEVGVKGKAFAVSEENDETYTKFDMKLYSNDIDVTALYHPSVCEAADVEFVVVESSEDEVEVEIDEVGDGIVTFTDAGVEALIQATFTYDNGEDDPEPIEGYCTLKSTALPAYKLKTVAKWTIVPYDLNADEEDIKPIDWNNVKHDIAAYDEDEFGDEDKGYKIVALISDNYGRQYVTDSNYANLEKGIFGDADESIFEDKGYSIKFESAYVEKLLVSENGQLRTHTKANAPVLVALYEDDEFVRYIGAVSVKVEDKRYISKIATSATKNKINVVVDGDSREYWTEYVEVYLYDQHGDAWTHDTNITLTCKQGATVSGAMHKYNDELDKWEVITDGDVSVKNVIPYYGATKKATLVLDGKDLYGDANKTGLDFILKANAGTKNEKSLGFDVTLKKIKYNTDSDGNVTGIKYSDSQVSATSVNTTKAADYKIPVENDIIFAKISNKQIVGADATVVGIYSEEFNASMEDDILNNLYLRVYDNTTKTPLKVATVVDTRNPEKEDGTPVTCVDRTLGVYVDPNKDGVFHVVAAAKQASGYVEYLAPGEYTAEIVKIVDFKDNTTDGDEIVYGKPELKVIDDVEFTITNDNKKVTFAGVEKDATDLNVDTTDLDDLKELVKECFKFNLGDSEWDFKEADITDVKIREIETSDYIVVTQVTFNVPLNENSANRTDLGYKATVDVNKAIQFIDEE